MLKTFPVVSFLLLFLTTALHAQFSVEKIEEASTFGFQKPLTFYSHPRYNRVEGPFANLGIKYRPPAIPKFEIYGDAGWGFENQKDKQFRYAVGIRKDFFEFERLSIGADVFRKVDSEDDWVVGEVENSLAALFFAEDYKDYFGNRGFKIYIDHLYKSTHTLRLEVGRYSYDALRKNTNFGIFDDEFPANPRVPGIQIAEGDEVSIKLIGIYDGRDNPLFPMNGWYLQGIYEHTLEDFDTDGVFVMLKRYQQTFGNQRYVVRAMLGTRGGSLADQHIMTIGGLGSLRGFDEMEFFGNRMLMLNVNYLFGGDLLQKIPLQRIPYFGGFWSTLSFGVFLDTGWAWMANPNDGIVDGFGIFSIDDLKTDVGFSIFVLEGVFRMDVAKRTDRSGNDFRVTFRLLEKL